MATHFAPATLRERSPHPLGVTTVAVLTLAVVAQAGCAVQAPVRSTTSPAAAVTTAFEDAKFVPAIPGRPDGARIAVLWGDPATGPSAMLFDLPKVSLPLHYHTADYHLLVIEGKLKHWGEDESEAGAKVLGPGSYWFQPGGKVHGDACLTERCIVHLVWSGPRDALLPSTRRP